MVAWLSELTRRTAKRLPYADHIIALGSDGKISEQGTFESLNAAGGYVSSFTLPPPDWAYNPGHDDSDRDFDPKFTHRVLEPTTTEKDTELKANRRTGDTSIYLYYIKLTGWIATIIFVVCITGFIFCTSFPSMDLSLCKTAINPSSLTSSSSYLGEMVGHGERGSAERKSGLLSGNLFPPRGNGPDISLGQLLVSQCLSGRACGNSDTKLEI